MRIVDNILELIGETPMLKLNLKDSDWNVYLKLEKFNPGKHERSNSFKNG